MDILILKSPMELFPMEPLTELPLKILSPIVLSVLTEEPKMLVLGPAPDEKTWAYPLLLFLLLIKGPMFILGLALGI